MATLTFTDAERADWQATFLTDSVMIRSTATSAGSGLAVTSTPSNGAPIAAKVDPVAAVAAKDAVLAAQLGQNDAWLVKLPVGIAVKQNDTILWEDKTLKVTRLLTPRTTALVQRVVCSERS